MYKLKIQDRSYKVFKQKEGCTIKPEYYMLCKVLTLDTLKGVMSQALSSRYNEEEVQTAVTYMIKNNHDTAEFGPNGMFTISYHSNELKG